MVNFNEGFKKMTNEMESINKQICIEGNHIVIKDENYSISLEECNTSHNILNWVLQLTEKPYITNNMMRRFIELATQHHGIDIHITS